MQTHICLCMAQHGTHTHTSAPTLCFACTQGEEDDGEDTELEHQVTPRTKSESAAREAWHQARRQRAAREQAGVPSAQSLEALLQRKVAAHAGGGAHTHKRPPRKEPSSLSQKSSSTASQPASGPSTPLSSTPPANSLMGGGPFTLGRFKAMMAHQRLRTGALSASNTLGDSSDQLAAASESPGSAGSGAEVRACVHVGGGGRGEVGWGGVCINACV